MVIGTRSIFTHIIDIAYPTIIPELQYCCFEGPHADNFNSRCFPRTNYSPEVQELELKLELITLIAVRNGYPTQ